MLASALRLLLLVGSLFTTACTTQSGPATAPLPDARELSENPLEVTDLPQP